MSETPDEILRALADPERLAIAGLLARGSASGPMLAAALDLPVKRVRSHLNRLASAGVVRLNEDRASYRLDGGTLRWAAEQVGPPRETGMALGAVTPTEESVLRTFFRNGRLTEIPAKRSKRRMVLERIALEFEPGRRYDEKEVNATVARYFTDHAALRRALVDEGFLDRDHGEYVGGRWGGPGLRVSGKATGASRRGPVLIGSASVQRRLRNVLLVTVLAVSTPMLLPSPAAAGRHPHHPCQLTRRDGETVQHFSKRQITCAVGAYGPVKGGITRAICIARRESGLIPSASSPKGRYLGLYQHSATYWPWRFDTYTQPSWSLSTSALSGRSNAIVTVRMVHSLGGWRHAGWPVKAC